MSGFDWLDPEQFPYWEDAMKIGNANDFLDWINHKDSSWSRYMKKHMAEFVACFAKVKHEISKISPHLFGEEIEFLGRKKRRQFKQEDGWMRVESIENCKVFYNTISEKYAVQNNTLVEYTFMARKCHRAEAEARRKGLLRISKRLLP